jgi:hypothetical protein
MARVKTPEETDERRAAATRWQWHSPLAVGIVFAVLATVISLIGLARSHNLSLRNAALAALLGGGAWGLVSWAIASAVVDVEEDVESGRDEDGGSES